MKMSVLGRKRDPAKAAKRREGSGYELPDDKLQQREKMYLIYQDIGPTRSITKLEKLLRDKHPEPRVGRLGLEKWSLQNGWVMHVQTHHAAAGNPAIDRTAGLVIRERSSRSADVTGDEDIGTCCSC
jgi:hypothetical protein